MPDFVLKLSKPIPIAGGEPLKQLKFREPMAPDAFELEPPFSTIMTEYHDKAGKSRTAAQIKRDPAAFRLWCEQLLEKPATPDVLVALTAHEIGHVFNWLSNELNPAEDEQGGGNSVKN